MGEARRRSSQGLPLGKPKRLRLKTTPRIVAWLPLTQNQAREFVSLTSKGAWVGIGAMALLWITVRFIGPAAGWWQLSDG
ncbi:DUF2839 domain-containing protein [Synechococcus lacustris Tous-12m]